MNGLTKELTTALVSALLASFSGCLGMGCVVRQDHDGEYGFEQSTRWGFYYTAKETADVEATIELDVPSVEEWIKAKADDDG